MSRRRTERIRAASPKHPINVSIREAGVRKVLTWKQYQEFLNPKLEVVN